MRREDSERGDMIFVYTGEVNIHKREELLHLKKSIITKTGEYTLAMQKSSMEKKAKKNPSNYERNKVLELPVGFTNGNM